MKIYINGKFYSEEEAKISVFDHGVLYGDGVFEGIRAYNSKIFFLEEHIGRLYNSAKAILLEIPLKKEELKKAIILTMKENNAKDAYIRVVVTRGCGDLGLDPRKCKKPTVFIIVSKIQLYPKEYYEKGIELVTVSVRRNLPDAINPSIKSLNYLNNILAKIEAIKSNAEEAIMLNKDGYVAECSGENIFIVKNRKIITPPIYVGALLGITRKIVIELAKKMKLETIEEPFTVYHIYTADECFITGTACEIMPVTKVDGRVIGDGKIGKLTKLFIKKFWRLTETEGTKI